MAQRHFACWTNVGVASVILTAVGSTSIS